MHEYDDGIYHNNKKSATNTNGFVLFYISFILWYCLYCCIYRHVFYVPERGEKRAAEARSTTIYHGEQFFSFVVLLYCRSVHCNIVFYSMHSPSIFRCIPTQTMNSIRNDNRLFLWSTQNIFQYIRHLLACLRYGGHIRQKQIVSKERPEHVQVVGMKCGVVWIVNGNISSMFFFLIFLRIFDSFDFHFAIAPTVTISPCASEKHIDWSHPHHQPFQFSPTKNKHSKFKCAAVPSPAKIAKRNKNWTGWLH